MQATGSFGPDAVDSASAWIKLCRAQLSVSARVFRQLPGRISLVQFAVLEAIDHLGPLSQREISKKILKSAGNVTVVVDNLEKAGFAKRERSSEDRRVVEVSVTDAGRQFLRGLMPVYMSAIQHEFEVLSPAERTELGRLCRLLGRGHEVDEPDADTIPATDEEL